MENNEFYTLVNEIRLLAAVITKIAGRDLEQRLEKHQMGLSGLQHGLLRMLSYKDYTISELSRKFILHPSTLVPAVDNLERKGLVKRGQDPKDRRRTPLLLTERGSELVQQVPEIDSQDALIKSLNALGPETSQELRRLLYQLVQHMPEGKEILQVIASRVPLSGPS